jgi:hypothetical protein
MECCISSDMLGSDKSLYSAREKFEQVILKALNSTVFGTVRRPQAICQGFFYLTEASKGAFLTLVLEAVKEKRLNSKQILSIVSDNFFNGQPKYFAQLIKTSLFLNEISKPDQIYCFSVFLAIGTDPKDFKARREITEFLWKLGAEEPLEMLLWEIARAYPFEGRFFEERRLLSCSDLTSFACTAATLTQMRLVLPAKFPSILKAMAKTTDVNQALQNVKLFEKSGLPLFESPEVERQTFEYLISDERNMTALVLAGFFFTSNSQFTAEVMRLANKHNCFIFRLVVGSRLGMENNQAYSADVLRWIYQEKLLQSNKSRWDDFHLFLLVNLFQGLPMEPNLVTAITRFFDEFRSYSFDKSELICLRCLILRDVSCSAFIENFPLVKNLINGDHETFPFLIHQNWDSLNREKIQPWIIEKLQGAKDLGQLVPWNPVICKARESFPGNVSLENLIVDLTTTGAVYRSQVLPVAEATLFSTLSKVSKAQLAAHWFFVDSMQDICAQESENLFLNILILACS